MKFGRKVSFTGYQICLDFDLRNRLWKNRLSLPGKGTVKIYDRNPKTSINPTLLAEISPTILSCGRMIAFWDIPEDFCPGIYYDSWEDFKVEGFSKSFCKVQQFYISNDLFSMEKYLKEDYLIEICPDTVFIDSLEYITFKMLKPSHLMFPPTEVRLIYSAISNQSFTLQIRKTGPGNNEPLKTNALFPKENVLIADIPVTAKSEFIEIPTFCDTAYFLFDTAGLKPGVLDFQLRLTLGEIKKVLRPLPLRVNTADLNDVSLRADPIFFTD